MDPDAFWRQTPRTFVAVMKGRRLAAEERHNEAMSQAWHSEAFARSSKLPKLATMMIRSGAAEPRRQTNEDLLYAMRAWAGTTKH